MTTKKNEKSYAGAPRYTKVYQGIPVKIFLVKIAILTILLGLMPLAAATNVTSNTTITVVPTNTSCPTNTIINPISAQQGSPFAMLCQGITFQEPFVFKQNQNRTINIPAFNHDRSKIEQFSQGFITIRNPNGEVVVKDEAMVLDFTGGFFNYSINDSVNNVNGVYKASVRIQGQSTDHGFTEFSYLVNPSGSERLSAGQGFILFGSIIIIIIIGIVFLFIAFQCQNIAAKVTFFALSGIEALIAILFTTVLLYEVISTNENLLSAYTTFFTVMQILSGIAIIALIIVVFLVFSRAWRIRRGLIDK